MRGTIKYGGRLVSKLHYILCVKLGMRSNVILTLISPIIRVCSMTRGRIKGAARAINAILLPIVLYFPCGGNY